MYRSLPRLETLKAEYSDTVFKRLWEQMRKKELKGEDISKKASFIRNMLTRGSGHISSTTKRLDYDPNEVAQFIIDNAKLYPYNITENDIEWWTRVGRE